MASDTPRPGMFAPPRKKVDRSGPRVGRQRDKVRADAARTLGPFPSDLVPLLLELRPQLRHETSTNVGGIAALLWASHGKDRRHKRFPGYFAHSHELLDGLFGRRKFAALNERVQVFDVRAPEGHHLEGLTRGFRPCADIARAIRDRYSRSRADEAGQVYADGTESRAPRRAVASVNRHGTPSKLWRDAPIEASAPMDRDALDRLSDQLQHECAVAEASGDGPGLVEAEQMLDELARIRGSSKRTLAGRSHLPHQYFESDAGRLYAFGVSLQNTPGRIRESALNGLWDYDIQNCHFALVQQLAFRIGRTTEHIDRYVRDKVMYRRHLAEIAGCTEDVAKQCLLAAMFGAATSGRPRNSVLRTLLGDAGFKAMGRDALIAPLFRELRQSMRAILKAMPRVKDTLIVNAAGHEMSTKEKPRYLMAHVLQGAEAKILRTCIEHFEADVVLPMHDGFVSRRRLPVTEIEAVVLERTGFKVSFKETPIKAW